MSDPVAAVPAKPVPVPDAASQPFYDAAVRDELLLQRCRTCDGFMWPVHPRCTRCLSSDLEWAAACGRGTVYSYTYVHNAPDPAFAADVPYNLVLVDLDEGVRTLTVLTGIADADIVVGLPVQVWFERVADDVAIPKFRPAEGRA